MSRRKSSASFTISWPFIIACVIGYNVFFGDDEDKKNVDVEPLDDRPAVVETTDKPNSIDDIVGKIKKEIDTSVVIQGAKEKIKAELESIKDGSSKKESVPESEPTEKPQEEAVAKAPPESDVPDLEPINPKTDSEPQFTDL